MTRKCNSCKNKEINKKINHLRHSPNFSGDKTEPGAKPNFFFCSNECKSKWVKETRKLDSKNLPYLAELDQSMNYCEYFIREKGNEGIYKKEGFKIKVNGLWDYKCYHTNISKANNFKEEYIKYFGNFNRFKLHNRYNNI